MLSHFSQCSDKIPDNGSLRKEGTYHFCVVAQGSHLAQWGRHGSLELRELILIALGVRKKKERERWTLVLHSLPPVYLVQDPNTGAVTSHI